MRIGVAVAGIALAMGALTASPALAADVCDGEASNPLCPVMDYPTAGGVFMEYMCPVNRAANKFNKAIRKYDRHDTYGDRPSKKTRAAARKLSAEMATLSNEFADGYTYRGFWPAEVADDAEAIAQEAFANSGALAELGKPGSRWSEYTDTEMDTDLYDNIRYTLGLPPRGQGC